MEWDVRRTNRILERVVRNQLLHKEIAQHVCMLMLHVHEGVQHTYKK